MRSPAGAGRVASRAAGSAPRPIAALMLCGLVVLLGSPAFGASDAELRQQKADVSARRAKVASQVDALRADDDEIDAALGTLQANVLQQRTALLAADASAQKARSEAERARVAEAQASERFEAAKQAVVSSAIAAYTTGGVHRMSYQGVGIEEVARAKAYEGLATGLSADALDRLRAASKDLTRLARQRTSSSSKADRLLRDAQRRMGSLNSALAQQHGFSDQVEARLEAKLAEADALSATDAALASEIAKRQAALAKKLASRPGGGGGGGGGGFSIVGEGEIVTVGGIRVHRSIAGQVQGLLGAASGAGLRLSGGGWRSSESQVALRRAHCGSSNYDIYHKPASQCRPPTARPGSSMHERGLAIDFTCNGALIRSRSDPCYRWLSGNAGRFGFKNLPSEPWHWSTTGQ